MNIQRTKEAIILKLPKGVDTVGLQRMVDYLKYKEATMNSNADQEISDRLAEESKSDWWKENGDKFIK